MPKICTAQISDTRHNSIKILISFAKERKYFDMRIMVFLVNNSPTFGLILKYFERLRDISLLRF